MQVNIYVNNAAFKMLKKSALKMFYEEGYLVNTLVRAQAFTQCILVSNTERRLHRAPLNNPFISDFII